jgi:hypothetical protein
MSQYLKPIRLFLVLLGVLAWLPLQLRAVEFHIGIATNLSLEHINGRALMIIGHTKPPEPPFGWGKIGQASSCVLGADADDFGNGKTAIINQDAAAYLFEPS